MKTGVENVLRSALSSLDSAIRTVFSHCCELYSVLTEIINKWIYCLLAAHEGDYWRLLIPGRYTVTACADEQYDCVSKSVVVVNRPHTVAQTVDFTLPLARSEQQVSLLTV